jgi:predicted dehydrogenase
VRPLGLALIGCGSIAQSAHLPALAALGGRVGLVAAMDVNLEAAERVGREWDAFATSRLEEALDRPGVQAVVVCTPEFSHREVVEAAAARGLHVLCEKPMAPSLADADAMIEAARKASTVLMIGHSRRFTGRYMALHEAVRAGELGELRLLRENERRSRPSEPHPTGYWGRDHWTGDPSRSVGAILTNGIHEADLFNWFTASRPVRVYAERRVTRPDGEVADFISFTVRYANGALAAAEVNNALPPGYPGYHELELFGTEGAARARDHEMRMYERFDAEGMRSPRAYEHLLHVQHAYVREHEAFLHSVESGEPPAVPAAEARLALAVALAADEAARTGQPVSLDEEGGDGR